MHKGSKNGTPRFSEVGVQVHEEGKCCLWWGRSGLWQQGDLERPEMGKNYVCEEQFAVFLSFPGLKR